MNKLEELKAAYEAAGSGTWEVDNNTNALAYPGWELVDTSTIPQCVFAVAGTEERFKFIALAHNLMPQLLRAVELIEDVAMGNSEYDDLSDRAAELLEKLK